MNSRKPIGSSSQAESFQNNDDIERCRVPTADQRCNQASRTTATEDIPAAIPPVHIDIAMPGQVYTHILDLLHHERLFVDSLRLDQAAANEIRRILRGHHQRDLLYALQRIQDLERQVTENRNPSYIRKLEFRGVISICLCLVTILGFAFGLLAGFDMGYKKQHA